MQSPKAPIGRSIELIGTMAELQAKYKEGSIILGDVLGTCEPLCGPNRHFPICLM